MPQKTSPFVEMKYGWDFGEAGWNVGADQNWVKSGVLIQASVDEIVSTLPVTPSTGEVYYLTTDNRLYFGLGGIWQSSPVPQWFTLSHKPTGDIYKFNGVELEIVPSPEGLVESISNLENDFESLGTSAFLPTEYFASQDALDLSEANTQNYVTSFIEDLANSSDVSKGVSLVGGATRTLPSFNSLRNSPGRFDGELAHIVGHTVLGVGGGDFRWVAGSVKVDDGGRVAVATGGAWERITDQYSLDDYGADPTGVTASDSALDAILLAYPESWTVDRFKQPIVFGVGRYRFTSGNKTMNYNKATFAVFTGKGTSTRIIYEGTQTNFLNLEGEFIHFKYFRTESSTAGKVFCYHKNSTGAADCDAFFDGVFAVSWAYVHHVVGRGSSNKGCTMGVSGTWAKVESPDPYNQGSSPANIGSVRTGMRRYTSDNLAVDGATAVFEFLNIGPAAKYINEVSITGLHGNTLGSVLIGGHFNYVTVEIGTLVNSFPVAAILCNSIKKLRWSGVTVRGYDDSVTPGGGTRSSCLVKADLESGGSTSDVLVDEVVISGVYGNLVDSVVYSAGAVGNIIINGLCLVNTYESAGVLSSTARLIHATGGVSTGKRVLINGLSIDCDSFAATAFDWSNFARTDANWRFGLYSVRGFTAPAS